MAARGNNRAEQYRPEDLQKFISDEDTGRAIEALKRANDVFDIIELSETQHSEMIQWLLNPREGHGQGDALLKDFLIAAWKAVEESPLDGRSNSALFFKDWTPSAIDRSGFESAIILREFSVGENKDSRLDILILDPHNRLVIVVENKYKAIHDDRQLFAYRDAVTKMFRGRTGFKDWYFAFIALDKGKSAHKAANEWKSWVYLDYNWLRNGAMRAETQMRRGNQSASLVIAYCQAQMDDYEPSLEKELDTLLSRLVHNHGPVLRRLAEVHRQGLGDGRRLLLKDDDDELWAFAQYYSELVNRARRLDRLSYVKSEFEQANPGKKFVFEVRGKYINIWDSAWERFRQPDGNWPFFVRAALVNRKQHEEQPRRGESADAVEARNEETKVYRVLVVYQENCLRKSIAPVVHGAMMEAFAEDIDGRKENAAIRRFNVERADENALIRKLKDRYKELDAALVNC